VLPLAFRAACLSLTHGATTGRFARPRRVRRQAGGVQEGRFVAILSQGRAGSTLILRMLNACPAVHFSGENNRAFDHLKRFIDCYRDAAKHHTSDFFKLAWQLPCDEPTLLARVRELATGLYNPGGAHRLFGFKEIRYGQNDHLDSDLAFLRELFPRMRVIFNVRNTEDCVKSLWWAADPEASRRTLELIRNSFWQHYVRHRDYCYWMPFEELKRGSPVLQGMFDFLEIPMPPQAAAELDVRMRQ
jgi:hypothetical protein